MKPDAHCPGHVQSPPRAHRPGSNAAWTRPPEGVQDPVVDTTSPCPPYSTGVESCHADSPDVGWKLVRLKNPVLRGCEADPVTNHTTQTSEDQKQALSIGRCLGTIRTPRAVPLRTPGPGSWPGPSTFFTNTQTVSPTVMCPRRRTGVSCNLRCEQRNPGQWAPGPDL